MSGHGGNEGGSKKILKRAIRVAGNVLVLVCLYFIFQTFWEHRTWMLSWRPNAVVLLVFSVSVVLYGASLFLLSFAWRHLLVWCGETEIKSQYCHAIYGRSQIAKYLPGNVFQYAGRYVLGRQFGLGRLAIIASSAYEVFGLLIVASAIGLVGVVVFGIHSAAMSLWQILGMITAVIILVLATAILTPRIARLRGLELPDRSMSNIIVGLALAYLHYLAFFMLLGIIFAAVVYSTTELHVFIGSGVIIATFSLAWIGGFVMPGAPAGVGIREAIIVVALASLIGESQALLAALVFRVVSVLGDVVFFLAVSWIPLEDTAARG